MLLVERDARGVARVILNRPELHNAFNETLIAQLTEALETLGADPTVRIVILGAAGKSFSAGADLNWMKAMASYGEAENLADARALARLMRTLDRLPKPTLARVQGSAFGGGVGLIACCDMAVAVESASFSLSEVRLGLIPAVISPYVVAAMGERAARRWFLTAERFPAAEAWRNGLVHEVVEEGQLDAQIESIVRSLLANGPGAVAEAKDLIFAVGRRPLEDAVIEDTARRIARLRAGPEGKEGVAAFLDKRRAAWVG